MSRRLTRHSQGAVRAGSASWGPEQFPCCGPKDSSTWKKRVIPLCVSFLKTGWLSKESTLASRFYGMAICFAIVAVGIEVPLSCLRAGPWSFSLWHLVITCTDRAFDNRTEFNVKLLARDWSQGYYFDILETFVPDFYSPLNHFSNLQKSLHIIGTFKFIVNLHMLLVNNEKISLFALLLRICVVSLYCSLGCTGFLVIDKS